MRIFGRDFDHLHEEHIQELFSLEREGAVYTDHWIDSLSDFRHIRIAFTPAEIQEYVRSLLAYDDFLAAGSPDHASDVSTIPRDIAKRADEYSLETIEGESLGPPWHCPAAFLGPELEALVCFTPESRRLILQEQGAQAFTTTVKRAVDALTPAIRRFGHREAHLQQWAITCEDDVRDLLYAMLRASLADIKPEEPVPSRAGRSTVADLLSQIARIAIEVKWVGKASDWKRIQDEIAVDIQSYGRHPDCHTIAFVIIDAAKAIPDPGLVQSQLSGPQVIDGKPIEILVFIREP